MAVEVRIPTVFRKFTGGEATTQVEPGTLQSMVDELGSRFPGLKDQLLTKEGDIHRFVNVYVNDEDARYLGKLEAPVADGDVVSLLPSVAGG